MELFQPIHQPLQSFYCLYAVLIIVKLYGRSINYNKYNNIPIRFLLPRCIKIRELINLYGLHLMAKQSDLERLSRQSVSDLDKYSASV
jgi:hypothetical protein